MKRCTLCGGKLNSDKRCTLCGLDNTKNDDMYKEMLNRNNCEDKPLTHIHEEPAAKPIPKRVEPKKSFSAVNHKNGNTYTTPKYAVTPVFKKASKPMSEKKEPGGWVKTLIGVLPVIVAALGIIGSLVDNLMTTYEYDNYYEEEVGVESMPDYDPYEWVIDEMPAEGEGYSNTFEPGIYQVGYHIPMGVYDATLSVGDYGYVEIYDSWNEIWIGELIERDSMEVLSDLRLYNGAYLVISNGVEVTMTTKNAQPLTMDGVDSTLVDTVKVENEMVEGEDFEAGVYDIVYTPKEDGDYRYISLAIEVEKYDFDYYISFDTDMGEEVFHNVPIPEGSVIYLDDSENLDVIQLIPTETESGSEHYEFYEEYWY